MVDFIHKKEGSFALGLISISIVIVLHIAAAYWVFGTTSAKLELLSMASEDLSEGASQGGAIEFVSIDDLLNPVATPEPDNSIEPDSPPPVNQPLEPEGVGVTTETADADIQQLPTPEETPQQVKEEPKPAPQQEVIKKPVKPKEKVKESPKPIKKTLADKPKKQATKADNIKPSGVSHGKATQAGNGGNSDLARGSKGEGKDATTSASHQGSYLNNPKPPYPAISIEKGEEGPVTLRVIVEPTGLPSHVEVIKSSGYRRLDRSALETVRSRYKFIPATRLGKPVQSTYTFTINFSLRDQ